MVVKVQFEKNPFRRFMKLIVLFPSTMNQISKQMPYMRKCLKIDLIHMRIYKIVFIHLLNELPFLIYLIYFYKMDFVYCGCEPLQLLTCKI